MAVLELRIPPPLVMLLTGLLMGLLSWASPVLTFWLPLQRFWGMLALGMGTLLIAVSVGMFIQARTTIEPTRPGRAAHLVVGGFNRITRNPMYLGMLLWLLAWSLWLGNLLALFGLPIFVLYMNRFQISLEERFLAEKFGDEYRAYLARVRRWI